MEWPYLSWQKYPGFREHPKYIRFGVPLGLSVLVKQWSENVTAIDRSIPSLSCDTKTNSFKWSSAP